MDNFWSDIIDDHTGPPVTVEMVAAAEFALGYKLPASYLELLSVRNGGYPRRFCFPTDVPTSWANDHIQISTLFGVGSTWGVGRTGSRHELRVVRSRAGGRLSVRGTGKERGSPVGSLRARFRT
jgi:hypothetical protein